MNGRKETVTFLSSSDLEKTPSNFRGAQKAGLESLENIILRGIFEWARDVGWGVLFLRPPSTLFQVLWSQVVSICFFFR